jgi:enamine deaminase RidA (YjgF/YER057c/UK114 family)
MQSIRHLVFAAALILLTVPSLAHDIVRRADSALPIATSVLVPAGSDVVFVGGTLPDAANPAAPAGSAERAGDTAAQAHSVLAKIAAELEAQGFAMSDVVKMSVFLVGDPNRGGAADYAGLMSAYLKYFGKEEGGLPARTTVQVAGLAVPGALVEIEVTAARSGDHPQD